jgi:hypothetical protein
MIKIKFGKGAGTRGRSVLERNRSVSFQVWLIVHETWGTSCLRVSPPFAEERG